MVQLAYNLIIIISQLILKIVALFSTKIKLFVDGRKSVFEEIENQIDINDKTIWFHAASLGEYEQGLPIMEKVKEDFPTYKIVLTFFSPSGYEIRKNNTTAHLTIYLPLDTTNNAKKFLKLVHPDKVIFIKYEFWPNYLKELMRNNIKTYLISGIFRKNQVFFKWYGGFYRNALQTFTHFFVQNEASKKLLHSIGYNHVTISGDTRFDRVSKILTQDNTLPFIEEFIQNEKVIVVGSSWDNDEKILVEYINSTNQNIKFIIAPHNIKKDEIINLKSSIKHHVVLFSEKEGKNLSEFNVFIIDTIGILTKIYSYADIAYVGGGFNLGIHNILEPATFGIPIIIGPKYEKFAEAVALVQNKGCISVKNQKELNEIFDRLLQNDDERFEKGNICSTFVEFNKGATEHILKKIYTL